MDLLLLILAGIAAVALGFWLGLPGKYEQTPDDIEKAMDRGGARRNQVKKVFTPLDWFRKEKRGSQRRIDASRRRFNTAAPEKRDAGGPAADAGGSSAEQGGSPGPKPAPRPPSGDSSSADEYADRHRGNG